ncbi:MAG TPA: ABC transporter substrate-binding protein [Chloroflexota bacterium]|nr:ABC transporter substrate-binding protein [Chloroflexota bacterium]
MPGRVGAALVALWLVAACQAAPVPAPASQPAAPSATADASQSAEVARLLAAARAAGETELQLSWSDNTLGGSQGAQRLARLFNETYGTSIQVNFTPGPTMTEMSSRVSQEVATGRKSETDLLLGGETHYAPLLDRDVLERYDYTQLSPRITPEIVAPNNVGVEVATRLPGITYNTNLVPPAEAPRTLAEALNPKWRDIMASTQNAANFDRVAARPEWGPERTKAYVARLSGNISGLVRCGETSRFMSGEFGMLVMDCGGYEVHKGRARGGPVGHVIPEDAPVIAAFYLGVPRTAAHPNLAKLFVNLVLSEAGQRTIYETEFMDHVSLPGSQSVAELDAVRAKGIAPLKVDARFVAEHPELEGLSEELTALLRANR